MSNTLCGIERFDRGSGLWTPTDEKLYERRRDAAYRMIELNTRSEWNLCGMAFRVTVIENTGND